MNQCYLFVQQAVRNFSAEHEISPHVHIILLVIFTLFVLLLLSFTYLSRQVSMT